MNFRIYQVDAFTSSLFSGNPAAVLPLGSEWLPDPTMQAIAAETNLADTAFYIVKDGRFSIRWFTPGAEMDLCGHATLAAAHVLFSHEGFSGEEITFASRSGELRVRAADGMYRLDFPADPARRVELAPGLAAGFNHEPIEAWRGKTDCLLVFESERLIRSLEVDFAAVAKVEARGIIVTAPGEPASGADFVSRFFAPRVGVNEDPVTGSAHTTLVPYWAARLGGTRFRAHQLSRRGGELLCELAGDRVRISGAAVTFWRGEAEIPRRIEAGDAL